MEGCVVTDLKVHSRNNCYVLSVEEMKKIEDTAVKSFLERGTNIIKIKNGAFQSASASNQAGEPIVLLWFYGGRMINKKTNVEVTATWSSLNGYDDALILEVLEPVTMCAFFFDTNIEDNDGEVVLSVVRV
ncbi:MAG: hypothetical protein QNJ47_16355 [Nostocaceae cyanobacterium]|nr:hypothetical protein [Nostocaceae cyanobacterium]